MAKYTEIAKAYADSVPERLKRQNDVRSIAGHVFTGVVKRAEVPEGNLRYAPPDEGTPVDLQKNYSLAEAVTYSSESSAWVIGYLLKVVPPAGIIPTEQLRFFVTVSPFEHGYRLGLKDTELKQEIARDESAGNIAVIENFCYQATNYIAQHYIELPERIATGGFRVLKGFSVS